MEKFGKIFFVLICFSFVMTGLVKAGTGQLESAVETKIKNQDDAVKSQQKIDKLADQTRDMVQEYREVIRKTDSLEVYNEQLAKLVKQQKESLNSIQRQLDNVEQTQRIIVSLVTETTDTYEQFVPLALPFLLY